MSKCPRPFTPRGWRSGAVGDLTDNFIGLLLASNLEGGKDRQEAQAAPTWRARHSIPREDWAERERDETRQGWGRVAGVEGFV